MSGFDGTVESLYFACVAGLAERGYNVLIFEGPGQRGISHLYPNLPFRPDYEKVVSKVVDFALGLPGIDPQRLGLVGYSFGGHLVLRAAAYEPRIKALVANSPVMNFGKMILDGFPMFVMRANERLADKIMSNMTFTPQTLQASLKRLYESMRVSVFSDFRRQMANYQFSEIEKITCPVLCMVSEGEGQSSVAESRLTYEKLTNPQKKLLSFGPDTGADLHCQFNNLLLSVNSMADWLDGIWN